MVINVTGFCYQTSEEKLMPLTTNREKSFTTFILSSYITVLLKIVLLLPLHWRPTGNSLVICDDDILDHSYHVVIPQLNPAQFVSENFLSCHLHSLESVLPHLNCVVFQLVTCLLGATLCINDVCRQKDT